MIPSITQTRIFTHDSALVSAIVESSRSARELARLQGRELDPGERAHADPEAVCLLLNAAFWASIGVEEGRPVRGVLRTVSPERVAAPVIFSEPSPLTPAAIVALTTAAGDGALGIQIGPTGLPEIWGFAPRDSLDGLRVRIAQPGTVIALVETMIIGLIANGSVFIPQDVGPSDWLTLVAGAFGTTLDLPTRMKRASHLLCIVGAMCRHGHGGAVVGVFSSAADWRRSVGWRYRIASPHGSGAPRDLSGVLAPAAQETAPSGRPLDRTPAVNIPSGSIQPPDHAEEIRRQAAGQARRQIGALTALDGAVVVSDELTLLGFSAKLLATASHVPLAVRDVLTGVVEDDYPLSEIGATRHQSAARFVAEHRAAVAFVASQDAHLTLFAWQPECARVMAVRHLECLIWEYA